MLSDYRIERRTVIKGGLAVLGTLLVGCESETPEQRDERRWQQLLTPQGDTVRREMGQLGLNEWHQVVKASRLSSEERDELEVIRSAAGFFEIGERNIEFVIAMNQESADKTTAANLVLVRHPLRSVVTRVDASHQVPVAKFDYDLAKLITFDLARFPSNDYRGNGFSHQTYTDPKKYFETEGLIKTIVIEGAKEDLQPLEVRI